MKVKSTQAKIGDWVFVLLCVIISIICVVPMVNLAAKSLSGTEFLIRHDVYLWPKGFNLDAYKMGYDIMDEDLKELGYKTGFGENNRF